MKTEVYSWRVSADLKTALQAQARSEGKSFAELLQEFASDGMRARRNGNPDDEAEQAALRKRVMATVGTIRGGDPHGSERVSEKVGEIIYQKHLKESDALARRFRRRTR
jgi:hypothetical protein